MQPAHTESPALQGLTSPGLLIDGRWIGASERDRFAVEDPSGGAPVAHLPRATTADLDAALGAAALGFERWRATDAWRRSEVLRGVAAIMRRDVELFALTMTLEQGKPLAESRAETLATADQFDWYADETRRIYGRLLDGRSDGRRLLTRREPIGPIAAFTAWNFPLLLPGRKLAAALAAGCSVVLKPAEEAPLSALRLAQACVEAGLPDGALNVVMGDPAAISAHLIASPTIRKVSLTGSVPVGRTLLHHAAEAVKPSAMELGGHAPVLVFADADPRAVAQAAVAAKFRNAGQVCASPTRFLVEAPIAEAFQEAFVEAASGLTVGPGADPATEVGPLTTRRQLEAVHGLVEDAVGHGATVRLGGAALDRPGNFYAPSVLTGVTSEMAIMTTEPFGPVAPIATFDTLDDAIAQANATPFGLASYVFTTSTRTAFLASERLEAGMVGVGTFAIATAEAPFGGVKDSGFGREGGPEGIEDYLVTKYMAIEL
ncbi:NAD-dependent succinate-semialdehyde dehydrogenase [Conexibacter arvalis]|uniref:NAD-dependent succinate-semialdehyde dehydrogenase n=1 Tax=Conexibacter arvalis TaxID=912552 RepID=UPI001C85F20C